MYKIRTENRVTLNKVAVATENSVFKNIFKEHLNQIRYNVKKHTFIITMTDRL